jgi:hypothetical protein
LQNSKLEGNGGSRQRRIRDADANENFGIENVLESSMNRIQSLLNYKLAYGRTETKKSLSL